MERVPDARQKRTRQAKQPMKVVHIMNPVRFKANASEFRSLVQELTGKDSDVADNMAKHRSSIAPDPAAPSAGDGSRGQAVESFDVAFQDFPWFVSSFNDVHGSGKRG